MDASEQQGGILPPRLSAPCPRGRLATFDGTPDPRPVREPPRRHRSYRLCWILLARRGPASRARCSGHRSSYGAEHCLECACPGCCCCPRAQALVPALSLGVARQSGDADRPCCGGRERGTGRAGAGHPSHRTGSYPRPDRADHAFPPRQARTEIDGLRSYCRSRLAPLHGASESGARRSKTKPRLGEHARSRHGQTSEPMLVGLRKCDDCLTRQPAQAAARVSGRAVRLIDGGLSAMFGRRLHIRKKLSRVHDVEWIECTLNRPHRRHGGTMFQGRKFALVDADAMLARTGPAEAERP